MNRATKKKLHFPKITIRPMQMTSGKVAVIGLIMIFICTILSCITPLHSLPDFNIEPLLWFFGGVGLVLTVFGGGYWFMDND